ncbi:MAG: TonB-dependent receptor [Candidatus Thiodiazotropha sp. (ex Ctena orbiculata)]|nr:TonB-dependent receptor [Candidatus Thiodiazotropha sp. (ex Codakia orbicularis)]MBV2126403.1 TonB-dependent receptor [Candidatus Thiodiazotropha taylori]
MPLRISIASALSLAIASTAIAKDNLFNPDISLILDGRFGAFDNESDYELPGFMLGGEAGRGEEGFHLGHNELAISANVDDLFYGKLTAAIADHEGETEVELEEAFIETSALGNGLNIKAGRFFSSIGYLNQQHGHAWDFVDAPLIYRGLFGEQLIDDGIQVSWVAPTDIYLQFGGELLRGERFPAGGASNDGKGASTLFAKIGGDIGESHAWQLGLSHWRAEVEDRTSGGHHHEGEAEEVPTYSGDSDVTGIDFVWKWAPLGNASQRNFKLQGEYFIRDEDGDVIMDDGSESPESTTYDGEQEGWYLQGIYQFMPRWRVGLRYDRLESDNKGSDEEVLAEAGLDNEGHKPERITLMGDYSHSEFSRLRLQYARDDSYEDSDDIVMLQFVMSLGPHGAHRF